MSVREILGAKAIPEQKDYIFALLPKKAVDVYEGFVKKAAEGLGFKCESFVEFKGPGDALADVLEAIKKAEVLLYDITDFTPNVMWELGVGLTLKDEDKVIVICEESDTVLPFNIYSHRISYKYGHTIIQNTKFII